MGIERYWLLVLFLFSVRSLCSLNVGLLLSWASSVPYVCVRPLLMDFGLSKLGMAVVGLAGTAETQHRL